MAAKKAKEKIEKKKISKDEIEKVVVDLGKKELTPAKIGLILQKEYGLKSDKKIKKILEKAGIKNELPEELEDLLKRASALQKHLLKNKMDKVAGRGLQLTIAKINKTAKYFKKKRVLSKDWAYKTYK
jgi:small subunit ribosomal protein S13e